LWFGAILGSIVLSWAFAATGHAETPTEGAGDPNDYQCQGHISAGTPELGSSEQQVRYRFSCSGPITGYQLQAQTPLTGFEASPVLTSQAGESLNDSFSCGGEVPGFAVNCEGTTKLELENITGQFAIGTPLCAAPHVDPLLTVTYAYVEKAVVTQAISGPFDLGRPLHCPASSYKGGTRLNPIVAVPAKGKANKHKRAKGKTKHGKAKKK
jgi:hypothetical protein